MSWNKPRRHRRPRASQASADVGDIAGVPHAPDPTSCDSSAFQVAWPHHLKHLKVLRGTEFVARVHDPIDWHRTGTIQYVVTGYDVRKQLYEAWEPSGLHSCYASEDMVMGGKSGGDLGDNDRSVARWQAGEIARIADFVCGTDVLLSPEVRDQIFPTVLSGWKPYGTLEMAGPMLFHLYAQRQRNPDRFRTVCDVGAGHGRMSNWLQRAWGFEATAFDVVYPEHPEFDVQLFDGRCLPLEDKSMDCIMFSFVLHHCRHFEIQRALLRESARVARHWILVAEDTPITELHWKATRGHDSKGQFHDRQSWRSLFHQLKLKLIHEGPLWEGPKNGRSPYHCNRSYFILEVPIWLRPAPGIKGGPGLVGCCSSSICEQAGISNAAGAAEEDGAQAGAAEEPVEWIGVADIRGSWLTMQASGRLESWSALCLPDWLRARFEAQGFQAPTPIQSITVPEALAGVDLVGVAKTGSGKTLAYLLPSLLRFLSEGVSGQPYVLVLAPTRELVLQIATCAEALMPPRQGHESGETGAAEDVNSNADGIAVAAVWGGGPRLQQKKQLRSASFVVASPGRLLDLICAAEDEGNEPLRSVRILILDEGDRMLEEGLGDQLEAIALRTAQIRQMLFFSATWPEEVSKLARRFSRAAPVVVRVGASAAPLHVTTGNSNIEQRIEVFDDDDESETERDARKRARLLQLLDEAMNTKSPVLHAPDLLASAHPDSAQLDDAEHPALDSSSTHQAIGKALVFCTTKKFADELVLSLQEAGWSAAAVHGNKTQAERLWNLDEFKRGSLCVLVATDVLGRGLDIPAVTHVFVYDFACTLEEYTHRIGRTARGLDGRGEAVAFFEYAPALPNLASELVAYLEAMCQPVPDGLRHIAGEVAAGKRCKASWNQARDHASSNGVAAGDGSAMQGATETWMPLAHPDELGKWHAAGQRSWLTSQDGGDAATGWLVLGSGGRLQTNAGEETWKLASGRLVITYAGMTHELELHKTWCGAHRDNFVAVASWRQQGDETKDVHSQGAAKLTGWVTRSKVYKYRAEN